MVKSKRISPKQDQTKPMHSKCKIFCIDFVHFCLSELQPRLSNKNLLNALNINRHNIANWSLMSNRNCKVIKPQHQVAV